MADVLQALAQAEANAAPQAGAEPVRWLPPGRSNPVSSGQYVTRTMGRRMMTCCHEAGHALVRWYFGWPAYRAVVVTVEDMRAGRWPLSDAGTPTEVEGFVTGHRIEPRHHPSVIHEISPAFVREMHIDAEIALIHDHAGIAAEAAYRRVSAAVCWMGGGYEDAGSIQGILDRWWPDEAEGRVVARLAEQRAAALVRSKAGSAAIKAIASALFERGEVDGDELAIMCWAAYGLQSPDFGAWYSHWPPRIADLRAGFIATLDRKAA